MPSLAENPLWWVAVIGVGVLGAARLTRLVVHDSWPPVRYLRDRWVARTSRVWPNGTVVPGPWTALVTCHYCFAPWAVALVIATAWVSDFHWVWWLFWGWLAAAYLASLVVEHDERGDGAT